MSFVEEYLWRVYVIGPPGRYETVVSATEPTVAPSDGSPINPSETIIMASLFINLSTPGYVNIRSELSDNQAIKIYASDPNGGIDMDAGFGGITIDTTNSISLDAAAASNFTTTVGNLLLRASTGLLNLESGAGINIGNSLGVAILIGTADALKHINIGSTNTSSSTTINSGTGGITIGNNSSGGEIHIASNNDTARTVVINNNNTFTRTFLRYGLGGGLIKTQGAAIWVPGDNDTNLVLSHLIDGILSGTPDAPRQLLLPNAENAIISAATVDDSIDFSVINKGIGTYTVVPGTGGSVDGNPLVSAGTSGLFRLRYTNVSSGTESYVVYRLS